MRTALRPLPQILRAREIGDDPDLIEKSNTRDRHEAINTRDRQRAESRLLVLGVAFFLAFAVVSARMSLLASSEPAEPTAIATEGAIFAQRADIVDRTGALLATNLITTSLYAQPQYMIDKDGAAQKLAAIFPDLDVERLRKDFNGSRKFLWIRRKLSPEQRQAVHDIGEPGLQFGPREMRLYPNGRLASHILGGAGFGREGVQSAEVIGVAGVEKSQDTRLRDPVLSGTPLALTIDLTIQTALERVLSGGMRLLNAKGAAAVLMDVQTGEIVAMASLPDFDPNLRPAAPTEGDPSESPLFNRAAQGLYELGSTFKIFTAALALETGVAGPDTMIDIRGPLTWGSYEINDFHNYGRELTLTDVIVKSSNIGSARLAQEIGAQEQQRFLESLGLFAPQNIGLAETENNRPLLPRQWSELSTMTISYGHGLAASPLHLATAYASLVNGGFLVEPTILKDRGLETPRTRVVSEATSDIVRYMLRSVVVRGTASLGDVEGYRVGGKTGSADKPKPSGGYYSDRVIATFASVFPADDPAFVLVVTLDEPVETSGSEPRRTAGWTAVPVAAEIIRRVAPLLGLRPAIDRSEEFNYMLTGN